MFECGVTEKKKKKGAGEKCRRTCCIVLCCVFTRNEGRGDGEKRC